MTLWEILDTRLKQLGWSYTQFAAKAGYNALSGVMNRLYRNDGMNMKIETLVDWATVLGLQVVLATTDGSGDEWILE